MSERRGYDAGDCARLLSVASEASAWGTTTWTAINGAWTCTWPVSARGYQHGELDLHLRINPRRASEPSLVYRIRGEIMRRVDVNGAHRGERFSHVQGADASGGTEHTRSVPPSFVVIPHDSGNVDGALYHRVLQDAAKLFSVDVSAVDWEDPPEGVPW